VADHGDLEQRAVGDDGLGDLADERDVVDHLRGDLAADVADDHRVAVVEAEEVRGVDARVQASDREQPQAGEDDCVQVATAGGEGAVAGQGGVDVLVAGSSGTFSSNLLAPRTSRGIAASSRASLLGEDLGW
jgi:hypothetical protein